MRKELYRLLCRELKAIDLINHIELWNHNVEFIEQEENWERPAVFVEFCPIQWNAIVPGVEDRAEPLIKLHIVTDWEGSSADGSELQEDALKVFDLPGLIHARLGRELGASGCLCGILPYTVERDCSRCGVPGRTFDQAAHRDGLGRFEC